MLHDSFWQAIENNPGESGPLLIAADNASEHGYENLSDCLRWAAANRKQCHFKGLKIYEWCFYGALGIETCYSLPHALFKNLRDGKLFVCCRDYKNNKSAWLDLAQAWEKATKRKWFRKSWEPNYEL